jgi:hypothetical protein
MDAIVVGSLLCAAFLDLVLNLHKIESTKHLNDAIKLSKYQKDSKKNS